MTAPAKRGSAFRRESLPPPRQFYEKEGFRLARPNRARFAIARGPIPCHKSKSGCSFFVNLDHGGWHCFGCGAHGDLVAFVQLRDRCTFKEACQRLGAWDEAPTPEVVRNLAAMDRERDRRRQAEAERQAEERRRRLDLRDEIHATARLHREACARLSELHEGAAPISAGEEEACWAVMALAFDDLRDCEWAYCSASGLGYNE